jgi:hypothetical protein
VPTRATGTCSPPLLFCCAFFRSGCTCTWCVVVQPNYTPFIDGSSCTRTVPLPAASLSHSHLTGNAIYQLRLSRVLFERTTYVSCNYRLTLISNCPVFQRPVNFC